MRYTEAEFALLGKGLAGISEKMWQRMVEQAAASAGWLYYHTYDSRKSPSGFPDLVLVRPPDVLFVELKTQNGTLTSEQKAWQQQLTQCPGVEYTVWRPMDYEQVTTRLFSREEEKHDDVSP